MQFYIDQNQVTYPDFLTKVKAASHLSDVQDIDVEVHWDNGQVYFRDLKCQKIELLLSKSLNYHKKFFHKNSIYRQPLFKAIGLKKGKEKPKVLDCTGGMLKDALLLYAGLNELSVCERNPLAQFLIESALKLNPLENFEFFPMDLMQMDLAPYDVFYYDPMFETVNKKAAPRKEMQFFRDFIGTDHDQIKVLDYLLEQNKRVVLKHSHKASVYKKPSMSFGEKSTIYDVYLS
jgi:hypothetical protein